MINKVIYFPGLNGIRAIAAIAVVISHIGLQLEIFNLAPLDCFPFNEDEPHGLLLASYGVSIFFVLSGFLITFLLQAEKEVQTIDVKKFYLRRILRIWPLYYLYLILTVFAIIFYGLDLNIKSLFLYLFYAANVPFILGSTLPFLAHYWSLGVEEQFYLFWPWFNKKIHAPVFTICILIVILIGTKITLHFFYPYSLFESIIHITRFHCMLIGALGAILYKNEHAVFIKVVDNKLSQSFCWIIMLFLAIDKFHFASVVDNEIISVVSLCLIIGQINVKNRIINLEQKILDFLGKISYGIYVIHPLIIFLLSKILFPVTIGSPYKYILVYLTILGSTIFLSYLSYIYFERYFLNYKERYTVIKSSGTKIIT